MLQLKLKKLYLYCRVLGFRLGFHRVRFTFLSNYINICLAHVLLLTYTLYKKGKQRLAFYTIYYLITVKISLLCFGLILFYLSTRAGMYLNFFGNADSRFLYLHVLWILLTYIIYTICCVH